MHTSFTGFPTIPSRSCASPGTHSRTLRPNDEGKPMSVMHQPRISRIKGNGGQCMFSTTEIGATQRAGIQGKASGLRESVLCASYLRSAKSLFDIL